MVESEAIGGGVTRFKSETATFEVSLPSPALPLFVIHGYFDMA